MDAAGQGRGSLPVFFSLIGIQLGCLLVALLGIYLVSMEVSFLGSAVWVQLLLGLLGAVVTYVVALSLIRSETLFGQILRRHCVQLTPVFSKLSVAQMVWVSIAAGVCEELLFRGFLQSWLSQVSTPFLGLLGASVIFAILHFASWVYFFLTLMIGLVLGIFYQISGGLVGVIVWHAGYDLLALIALIHFPHLLGIQRRA
ncbi:CPBP family intramembrane metalloprotease [Microbulbifer sp. OS29]|uniref:CPBP family intramembrane metalloprotease n=1 Tax=Microbulbifer okhotskensis TaxID=2926617 RepID=A0A9X2J6A1_9GAMM|nr:CPBP family glutamic-type intramembrane protease [Microbulbifer okhotskensis]MCO1334410.1 CPBP family intramembrane metalloprotease [Microbulbifer okhotskensis]